MIDLNGKFFKNLKLKGTGKQPETTVIYWKSTAKYRQTTINYRYLPVNYRYLPVNY